jgi:anti-anti-sigma factor
MSDYGIPVRWNRRLAIIALPERIDAGNADQIRKKLLSAIDRSPITLIADLTATASCDRSLVDLLLRGYHRAAVSGTELRLVAHAQIVRRMLRLGGIDHLIMIHPSLRAAIGSAPGRVTSLAPTSCGDDAIEFAGSADSRLDHAALAASRHRENSRADRPQPVVTPVLAQRMLDALPDGIALTSADGTVSAANRRLEEMFGYGHDELVGLAVESLIPADMQPTQASVRADHAPAHGIMRADARGARFIGRRKDGSTFSAQISLSPMTTAAGHYAVAVIRDVTDTRPGADPPTGLRPAWPAMPAAGSWHLFDTVISRLFQIGFRLQNALCADGESAVLHVEEARREIDDAIREVRGAAFSCFVGNWN